jgi:hypothetical protein
MSLYIIQVDTQYTYDKIDLSREEVMQGDIGTRGGCLKYEIADEIVIRVSVARGTDRVQEDPFSEFTFFQTPG